MALPPPPEGRTMGIGRFSLAAPVCDLTRSEDTERSLRSQVSGDQRLDVWDAAERWPRQVRRREGDHNDTTGAVGPRLGHKRRQQTPRRERECTLAVELAAVCLCGQYRPFLSAQSDDWNRERRMPRLSVSWRVPPAQCAPRGRQPPSTRGGGYGSGPTGLGNTLPHDKGGSGWG
jgi:hypothetical protein